MYSELHASFGYPALIHHLPNACLSEEVIVQNSVPYNKTVI